MPGSILKDTKTAKTMAKRQASKYHFLRVTAGPTGKSILTLPGQTLLGRPVMSGVLVKDIKYNNELSKAKRKAKDGDIFFTTTLRALSGCYAAASVYEFDETGSRVFPDVKEEFDALYPDGIKTLNLCIKK